MELLFPTSQGFSAPRWFLWELFVCHIFNLIHTSSSICSNSFTWKWSKRYRPTLNIFETIWSSESERNFNSLFVSSYTAPLCFFLMNHIQKMTQRCVQANAVLFSVKKKKTKTWAGQELSECQHWVQNVDSQCKIPRVLEPRKLVLFFFSLRKKNRNYVTNVLSLFSN